MGFVDILKDLLDNLNKTGFNDEKGLKESVERIKNDFPEGNVERVIEQEAEKFDDDVEELAGYVFYSFFSNGAYDLMTGDNTYISMDQSRHTPLKSLNTVNEYAIPNLFEFVGQETEWGGYATAEQNFECALKVAKVTPLPQRYENLAKKGLPRVEKRYDLIEEAREISNKVNSDINNAKEKIERAEKLLDKADTSQKPYGNTAHMSPGSGAYQPDWKYDKTEKNEKIMKEVQKILDERKKVLEKSGMAGRLEEICQELRKLSDPKSIDRDIETIEEYKIG